MNFSNIIKSFLIVIFIIAVFWVIDSGNYFESFVSPLLITVLIILLWKSGLFSGIERWMTNQNKKGATYKSDAEFSKKIEKIRKSERK